MDLVEEENEMKAVRIELICEGYFVH